MSSEVRNRFRNQLELVIDRLDTSMKYGVDMESSMIAAAEDASKYLRTALADYAQEKDTLYKIYEIYRRELDLTKNVAHAIDNTCAQTDSSVNYVLISIRRYENKQSI